MISVGEPINREAWEWLHNVVGDSRCTLVDTWWQTGESVSQKRVGVHLGTRHGAHRGAFPSVAVLSC